MPVGTAADGLAQRRTALASRPERLCSIGVAQLPPRLLATLSASLVRLEIASRSCCAASAMIPIVRSFASGRSA